MQLNVGSKRRADAGISSKGGFRGIDSLAFKLNAILDELEGLKLSTGPRRKIDTEVELVLGTRESLRIVRCTQGNDA